MCGIVGGVGEPSELAVDALAHRGPDARGTVRVGPFWLGHTRLAILDLDRRSDQPFMRGSITLTYNGELWNFRALRDELLGLGERFSTTGDTEVVAAALDRWGAGALARLDGMFALAWTDGEYLWVARDRFGEVPVHVAVGRKSTFASELRAFPAADVPTGAARWVEPGTVVRLDACGRAQTTRWYSVPTGSVELPLEQGAEQLYTLLDRGVRERSISDVPVCSLLSGGIDSSAVLLHLAKYVPGVVAFIAVYDPKSPDLRCARTVAEQVGVELREVPVPAPSASDLAGVVRRAEMPHKVQVEIGWACLHLARRMQADGFKVTFGGDGSDELWASYGFSYHGVRAEGWYEHRKRMFVGQHRKIFARANKIFLAHGVECRLPFLHTSLVEWALPLARSSVQDGRRPKAVLDMAYRGRLPDRVVNRPKLAFQDGMGIKSAAERAVGDPRRFYAAVFHREFRGAKA